MSDVGFIGLGRMGLPMCHNLLAAGHALTVYNRTAAKAEPLAALGARVATSVQDVAASCDVIITCLDTIAASSHVFLADDGIIAHARRNAVLVDHSTITPELARQIAGVAQARSLEFLDAPVSGGPEGAANATLAIMAGGTALGFARALPVMQAYGKVVRHMGNTGSGTHAKLVNQLLTFAHGAAAAEAIGFAERTGLDLDALMEVLRSSFGYSRMLERTFSRVQADSYGAGAALGLYDKDMRIVSDVGTAHDLLLPVTEAVRTILDDAVADGMGGQDIAALLLRYRANGPYDTRTDMTS